MPYLDISYCLTVAMVSSIVLLQRVFTDETKKLRADMRTWPFLVKFLWVSLLYRNSSCSSGLLWARSLKQSPRELWNHAWRQNLTCIREKTSVWSLIRRSAFLKIPILNGGINGSPTTSWVRNQVKGVAGKNICPFPLTFECLHHPCWFLMELI